VLLPANSKNLSMFKYLGARGRARLVAKRGLYQYSAAMKLLITLILLALTPLPVVVLAEEDLARVKERETKHGRDSFRARCTHG
jgi:hypothetical protein